MCARRSQAKPGKPAKQDNEYERCGTANVFGVVEPKTGRHFTTATPDRSGAAFARMVGHVVEQYPFAKTIHLVMDNLNSHTRNSLINCYGEQEGGYLWDRLTVHYTPKHGSWLNQAEIELSMYSRQCLGKRRFPDVGTLRRETKAWNETANRKRTKRQAGTKTVAHTHQRQSHAQDLPRRSLKPLIRRIPTENAARIEGVIGADVTRLAPDPLSIEPF